MEYFGNNTIEQKLLDFTDQLMRTNNLDNRKIIGVMNKVLEYYREGLMYHFDEDEFKDFKNP